jgi:capsular polysaccharide biosynthesis protein
MELKEILNFIKQKSQILSLCLLVGGILGTSAFFLLPTKYLCLGTLYVARQPEESSDFYTYSGYYAQQVALSYAETVKGLLENNTLQARALEELEIPVTEKNLRKLQNKVKVIDAGPQLVALEVKEKSQTEAREVWEALTTNITATSTEINKKGDSKLNITRVKEEPVTKETYKNLYVFSAAGGLLSLFLSTTVLGIINYMKEEQDE